MSWMGVITNAGQELLNTWASGGHTLTIEGVTVGTGFRNISEMEEATALVSEVADASLIGTREIDNATQFRIQISAAPVTSYIAHEIGIWAHVDDGSRTLLALHQDRMTGVNIPSVDESPNFSFVLYAVHAFRNDGTMTVNIDASAYITATVFNEAISEIKAKALNEHTEVVTGLQAGAVSAWTGNLTAKSLTAGKSILYVMPYGSAKGKATLNLVLADGTATGAKTVKGLHGNAIASAYPEGAVLHMIYDGTNWIVLDGPERVYRKAQRFTAGTTFADNKISFDPTGFFAESALDGKILEVYFNGLKLIPEIDFNYAADFDAGTLAITLLGDMAGITTGAKDTIEMILRK